MAESSQTGAHSLATGASEPLVVCEEVVKVFGKLRVLDGLNLTIGTGETFGLVGPNGSGKTTLMRILAGLVRPTAGSVRVLGRPMPEPAVAASIGYMTQLSALYLDLTARENLRFFCSIYGLRGQERERRINEILERVELSASADRVVATFSGGMRQRLSLACALVHRPRLALLDEPTVGVDPELRRSFWDYFAQLNGEGTTIVVSTHHLDEAARCSRLGLLRFGKLLACGTPQALLAEAGTNDMEAAFLHYAARERRKEVTA
ncbi:MAG: heme ABC exporter ATP-binding protein CcmA [Thermogemmatispora sp.]|jgi:ABC-2 type transport system ATP-binding protein|uniref:heme ABC exporter ATP-binding protein CcmA n=1 Tax=Thermogemmatispora sp. TaxID=1968838 RepID=UPI0019DE9FB6|nr:heme ABC exporter ATP-binding protein CcmA [Thermogemmatispora sp.]MBE3565928.1 heme ABC exporter ATP-binding protein CcmA [Thermogemmatispora sp.]